MLRLATRPQPRRHRRDPWIGVQPVRRTDGSRHGAARQHRHRIGPAYRPSTRAFGGAIMSRERKNRRTDFEKRWIESREAIFVDMTDDEARSCSEEILEHRKQVIRPEAPGWFTAGVEVARK